jgi:hypothetical protein
VQPNTSTADRGGWSATIVGPFNLKENRKIKNKEDEKGMRK